MRWHPHVSTNTTETALTQAPFIALSCNQARPTSTGDCPTSGEAKRWGAPGYRFGEPTFVASPGSTTEDDGVLLATGTSEHDTVLAVASARDMGLLALARVAHPVPLGFRRSFAAS